MKPRAIAGAAIALSLGSGALASDAITLVAPESKMVRLARAKVRLGSTREEVVRAAERCNRDAQDGVCTPETFADELEGADVVVESFWLDRHEVSYAEYARCVSAGRCRAPAYEGATRFERSELPVVFVSFRDAVDFCAFRGARLPTEAELERAMRGSSQRRFPWGDGFHGKAANHGRSGALKDDPSDGFDELAPVDSFVEGRSPEGVSNLAGNVAEWTSSRYVPYSDPGAAGSDLVVRGGHYLLAPAWLRGAARQHEPATRRAAYLGFRCARSDERASAR